MAYSVGIDLGTTFTAAAVIRDATIEMVNLGSASAAIPSVLVLEDGVFVIGEIADQRSAVDPSRSAREFKRRMGDPAPVLVGGAPYPPHLLMARLLENVLAHVTEREGEPPTQVALTHPANWGEYRRDLFTQMARGVAGDIDVLFITEPEAAAIDYASRQRVPTGAAVAVYDLGGGTFDAAILRRDEDGFEILGNPGGVEHLGGLDFDAALFSLVREHAGIREVDETDPSVTAAMHQLRRACVEAKIALSSSTDTTVPVFVPGATGSVRVTRAEFEDLAAPLLDESVRSLQRAVADAGVEPADLHAVLLVGGSSRIPLVAQRVTRALGRPVAVDADPKNAIARGAARAAEGGSSMPAPEPAATATPLPPKEVESPASERQPPADSPHDAPPPTRPPSTPPPVERAETADGGEHERNPLRSPPVLIAGAVILVVALIAAIAVLGGSDDDPTIAAGSDGDNGEVGSDGDDDSATPEGVPTCTSDSIDDVLHIGVAAPRPGALEALTGAEEGALLAAEDINAAGGVLGNEIEVTVVDAGDTDDLTQEAFEELDQAGADVTVGPLSSDRTAAVVPDLTGHCMIAISPAASDPTLADIDDDNLFLRTIGTTTFEARFLLELAGGGSIVQFDDNDPGGFSDELFSELEDNAGDFGTEVERVESVDDVDPDADIVVITFETSASDLGDLLDAGVPAESIAAVEMSAAFILEGLPDRQDELAGLTTIAPGAPVPDFLDGRLSGSGVGELYVAEGYDAVVIAALAASAAGTDDTIEIISYLGTFTSDGNTECNDFGSCVDLLESGEDITYRGALPTLVFDAAGNPTRATYIFEKIGADGAVDVSSEVLERPS